MKESNKIIEKLKEWLRNRITELDEEMQQHEEHHLLVLREKAFMYKRAYAKTIKKIEELENE